MKKTQIIELYGGPGSGKSTCAAFIFYQLKIRGLNSELVREYVKEWAWEGRKINSYDQIYFFGKQARKESLLYGKCDWIITDSPLMMNYYYANLYCPDHLKDAVKASVTSFYKQADLDNYTPHRILLERNSPYQSEGRFQNENEAKEMDNGIRNMLDALDYKYTVCKSEESSLIKLVSSLVGEIK